MIIVNDRPCNGVDLSHWNADPMNLHERSWLEFFGHKATHPGGSRMVDGVDPKFASRRLLVDRLDIRWRAFYCWVLPATTVRLAAQVELLARTVGDLKTGESVYLDWEDVGVTLPMIEEISFYMNLEFPGRWFMYVNDATPDMTSWLTSNLTTKAVPVMHPNYSLDSGFKEAKRWNASVWQTFGEGGPPGFPSVVPIDFVMQPKVMDKVCGRTAQRM